MPDVQGLKPRSLKLLRLLLDEKEPLKIDYLARQFGASPRTIRYNLVAVRDWVAPRGMALIAQPHRGVRLTGNPDKVMCALGDAQRPSYQSPLSVPDRRRTVLLALLQSASPLSLAFLAECLYVSRSTIKSDVAVLRQELLNCEGLSLKDRPGIGHYVSGDEATIRRLLVRTYFEEVDNGIVVMPWAGLVRGVQMITRAKTDAVWQAAGSFRIETRLCLDPGTFRKLVAMLVVSVGRALIGFHVEMAPGQLARLLETREFPAVAKLAKRLKELTGADLREEDIAFLTMHLLEMGQALPVETEDPADRMLAEQGAETLIAVVEDDLGLDLHSDSGLWSSLTEHIRRVVRLGRLGISVSNPLLGEIKRQYPDIFRSCAKGADRIVQTIGMRIGEDETGYLTMHIGAALERQRTRPKRVLVCTNGASSGKLLAARLERNFKDLEIADIVSLSQVFQYNALDRVDFIVSSVPFSISKDVVVVSPLLHADDLAVLEARGIFRTRQTDAVGAQQKDLAHRILRVLSRHVEIPDKDELLGSLYQVLGGEDLKSQNPSGDTQRFDIRQASLRLAQHLRRERPKMLEQDSMEELERRCKIGLERLVAGIPLPRSYLRIAAKYPRVLEVSSRFLNELSEAAGHGFNAEEVGFLAVCLVSPEDDPLALVELPMLASRDLKLEAEDMAMLEKLLCSAYKGARTEGITLDRGTLFDLALHLASTVLMDQDVTILKEMASQAASELTPAMTRACKAMGKRMSSALGRKLEPWEETYLALYAGAAVLRGMDPASAVPDLLR